MSRFKEDNNDTAISFSTLLSYLNDAFRLLNSAYKEIAIDRKSNPYKKPSTTKTWHIENIITKDLVKIAENKSLEESLNFDWVNDSKDLKRNNMIDIDIIYQAGLGKEKRLGIECKHLINNTKNDYYVKEGIDRFLSGKYSSKMPIAGMLGYIEKGKIYEITTDLNKRITPNTLKPYNFEQELEHSFISEHDRSYNSESLTNFRLYHVFFDFRNLIERNKPDTHI
ncbi:MAG: hypothetical protein AB8G86_09255 [Saprospiraceae bacterium]